MEKFHNFQEAPVIKTLYDLYKTYYACWQLFPKKDKYALGAKCENLITAILELILTAQSLPKETKKPFLMQASAKLDTLKIFIRLLKDINVIELKKYLLLQTLVQEIGRQLGGWQKSL